MGVMRTLMRQLAADKGLELSEDDLDELGLSDDSDDEVQIAEGDILSQSLPGRASGYVELFLGADSTAKSSPISGADNLMWYPIIREGQWAVRPGTTGKKRRVPLQVVGGKSANQRKQIGLQDLLDAFNDNAIQHVTVPTSHDNTVLENTGFVKSMKIVDGTVKDPKSKEDKKVKVLMGGYDIKLPQVKKLMELGTIANRSAGILYDYVNTETGKLYAAVVEHVALTNKPWITSMASFGRKLRDGSADPVSLSTVALSLSDSGPDTHEFALMLSEEASIDENELDFLADEASDWSKEDSPRWLRQQVDQVLRDARSAKLKSQKNANATLAYDDYPPHYQCQDARPGMALISDGYSDDSNHWAAPISVKDGAVQIADFSQWKAVRKAFIPDERPAPSKDKLPLDQSDTDVAESAPPKTRLQLAQEARRQRFSGAGSNPNTPREVVEHDMADQDGTVQLSTEARQAIEAAESRAKAAEDGLKLANDKIARLTGTVNGNEVDSFIKHIASDEGLGLSEARGFGGALTELRAQLLADDHEPAIASAHFSDDGKTDVEITLSEGYKRFFSAIQESTKGKKSLGELLSQPADGAEEEPAGDQQGGSQSQEGGNQPAPTTTPGKPGSGDDQGDKLSTDQKVDQIVGTSPELARLLGRKVPQEVK